MKIFIKKHGQSTMEYAIMLTAVIGALLVSATYIKRGVQGRWKSTVDDMGDQYEPKNAQSTVTYEITSQSETVITTQNDAILGGVWTNRVDNTDSSETKTGSSVIDGY